MSKQLIKIALATTALTSAVPAIAQSADDAIVVTARRVEERLQDVPISITVFNQQELTDRNVTNAQDLATFTPSLSATTNFGSDNSTFAIRGFVQETGTAPSVGVYFADVVAPRGASQGFPAGDGAGPGAFFDLQNVQVLKGPQGTLFGRNTTGGAVLLVPNRPTGELEGYVEASLGNYDMRRVQAVLNVPLAETFKVRLGVDRQKRDGFLTNTSGIGPRDYSDTNYLAVRASVIADLTPDLENYTIASYTKSDTNGFLQKLFACNPSSSPTNFLGQLACGQLSNQDPDEFYDVQSDMPDPYSKLNQWQVINTTTWQATDNLTIKNIISYAELWTRQNGNIFGSNFLIPQGALGTVDVGGGMMLPFPFTNTPIGFAVIRNIPGGDSSNQRTFTEEFRLEGTSFDGALNWQTGAYYEDATPNGFVGSQSPVLIGCSDSGNLVCTDVLGIGAVNYTVAKNTFNTRGLYAQGTYALNEKLKVTGGFRYTWDKIRSVSRRITYTFPRGFPDASPNPLAPFDGIVDPAVGPAVSYCADFLVRVTPLCELDQKVSFSKPTWVVGLDFNPTPDTLLYGKYSRGYRAGGIKSDVPTDFVFFDPEKVDTFEVGAKTSFSGAVSGYFNIAAFYNDFSNQQIQLGFNPNFDRRDANGDPLPTIPVTSTAGPVNVGKSRIWGIEVDARIRPFEGLVLSGAYTYLNTKVQEVSRPTLPSDDPFVVSSFPPVGVPLTFSPEHKFTATAAYTLPLDESVGEVSLGVTYVYIGSQISNYDDRVLASQNVPLFPSQFTGVDLGRLPSTNLVNLNVNWDSIGGAPIDLSVFVTNLTKEEYYTSVPGLMPATGFSSGTVGEPRMYGVRLRYSFGR